MKEAEAEHLSVIDGNLGVCGLAAAVQSFVFVPRIPRHPGDPQTNPLLGQSSAGPMDTCGRYAEG